MDFQKGDTKQRSSVTAECEEELFSQHDPKELSVIMENFCNIHCSAEKPVATWSYRAPGVVSANENLNFLLLFNF